jgi:FixJ family two-component response regulator
MVHAPALIAVVEDDARVRIALDRLLQSCGYAVLPFGSGAAFLAAVDQHEIDCVVLDLHMPGMRGFEVQKCLAALRRAIPVVVITGQDSRVARQWALAGGASAYLCKPVDREVLTAAIESAIQNNAAAAGT